MWVGACHHLAQRACCGTPTCLPEDSCGGCGPQCVAHVARVHPQVIRSHHQDGQELEVLERGGDEEAATTFQGSPICSRTEQAWGTARIYTLPSDPCPPEVSGSLCTVRAMPPRSTPSLHLSPRTPPYLYSRWLVQLAGLTLGRQESPTGPEPRFHLRAPLERMVLGSRKGGRGAFRGDPQHENKAWTTGAGVQGSPPPLSSSSTLTPAPESLPRLPQHWDQSTRLTNLGSSPCGCKLVPSLVWAPQQGSHASQLGPLGHSAIQSPRAVHPPRSLLFRPSRKEARPTFFLGGLSFSGPAGRRPLEVTPEGPGCQELPDTHSVLPHGAQEPRPQGALLQTG